MSDPGARQDPTVAGVRPGEEFDLVLPNFATAGFRWEPRFDEACFVLVGVERPDAPRNQIAFRFRMIGSGGQIRFLLARPGRPPRQERAFTIPLAGP